MNVILTIQIVDENKDEYDADNILSQIEYR